MRTALTWAPTSATAGRVEGNDIICPFHAWRFGASGRCTEVPYASRIPPRAAVNAYRVQEHSGMILAYFGPEGSEPDYEVPADRGDGRALPGLRSSRPTSRLPRSLAK